MATKTRNKGSYASGKSSGSRSGGKFAAKPRAKMADGPSTGMTTTQKVTWFSLHALVLLVPIAMSNANWVASLIPSLKGVFGVPFTYDQFDIVKVFVMRACALVGLGAWTFDFFMYGGKLRRTRADWLILGFLGWVLLTSFFSISPATAIFGKYRRFEGFLSFLTYAIVFFLIVQIVDRPSRIRSLAKTFTISGGIVAGYGVLQFLGLDPITWVSGEGKLPFEFNRSFSTFGNPDLLGGFLVLLLPVVLAMALTEKRARIRSVYWGVFIITVTCWITAFVRGAWIGGAIAVAIMIVGAVLASAPWGRTDWIASGATGFIGVGIIAWSLKSANDVLNVWLRLKSIFQFGEGSAKTRFEIWSAALRAVKERPLFGWGADTFRLVFPHTKPVEYVKDAGYLSVADNVHDYPLQLAAGIGVIGMLLLYGIFGWMLYLGFPNAFSKEKKPERLLLTAFWAAAVGYIAHLMTGLSVTGSTVFLWVAFAMILAPTARSVEIKPKAWGSTLSVVLTAVIAAGAVYNVAYIVADNFYLKAQFGSQLGSNPIDSANTAIALNAFNDMYRSQLGQAYTEQMMGWMNEARQLQQNGGDYTTAIQNSRAAFQLAERAYLDAVKFVPTEYDNYVFMASLYNQAGSVYDRKYYDQAVAIGKRGIEVERFGPAVRLQTGLALLSLGRNAEAIDLLQETAPMDPSFVDPRLLLADAYAQNGQSAKARAEYDAVMAVQPGNSRAQAGIDKLASATVTPTSRPKK